MVDFPGKRGNRKRHSLPSLSLARTQPNTTSQSDKLPLCHWESYTNDVIVSNLREYISFLV